ncbi:tudor domain-containing protein qin isoform X2 [Lasioglossum baleicum]|uniref:tudor domain-containing protein qin isoform X2 n=1 Tax=Lasioglossum baleicum TaxID=434251 RepID=UPI003FCC645E
MSGKRNDGKQEKNYSLPTTKLKNVYCTHCKHQFFLQDFIPLRGTIPVLMECGHIVCEKCSKLALGKPCPSCNVILQQIDGLCQECGIHASIKCPQCDALYCSSCYNKIHGRALNSHSKIVLTNNATYDSYIVQNTCSERCNEALGYFCEECEMAGCSHCMLRMHQHHNYVALAKKNHMFLEEFRALYNLVGQKLQRIQLAQKKLKSAMTPTAVQNGDKIETTITQHFAYLHGVLQNMERKMIDSLNHQRDSWNDNIDEITTQLKEHEERLQTAFIVIGSVEDNLDKIDIQRVIKKLRKVVDIPCHLLTTSEPSEDAIRFDVDESIVDTMQKHCAVHIPTVSSFSLQRTELLPDDYEMEPIMENISIPRGKDKSSTGTSVVTLPSRKDDNNQLWSSKMVRVTHVVDPSCFYVQLMQNRNEILELQEGLKTLEDAPLVEASEVKINGLYAVQSAKDRVWYRGRVVNQNTANNDKTYTVFFIDYGKQEENVPLTKMRNIGARFATLPVMVYRCSLYDIVPNGGHWDTNAIEAFKKLLTTHDMVSMNIAKVNGDTFYVDICAASYKGSGMVSAKESLTFMKHATCVSTNKLMRMNPYSTRTYYKETLDTDNYVHCDILFVESPSCIYVKKRNAQRTHFNNLPREMKEAYEDTESDNYITAPYKDLPCAARDADGNWHRGTICDVTENTVKVFFVDLGYSLILSYDSIRTLSKNFLSIKTQAIKVSLRNIKPHNGSKDQWGLATVEYLKKLLKTSMPVKVIAFERIGDTHVACVQTTHEGDISQLLIKHKLAMSTKINSNTNKLWNSNKKWKRKRVPSSAEVPIRTSTLEVPEQLREMSKSFSGPNEMDTNARKEKEDPFKVEVIVKQVESPDCIYVSDAMCEYSDIEKMIKQMQQFYGRYRSAEKVWKEGAVCAVFLSSCNMYYRGTIVEMKENDQAVVFLYDLGLEETVPLTDLQSLYLPFFKVPAYGFKIKLAGILPCGGSAKWPSLSCEKLKEITIDNCNCKFYISKLEEDDITESAIPVELWIKQNKVDGPLFPTRVEINSVNRMLVEKGVALPIKEYAKKRDKILAIELKAQLTKKLERLTKTKANVEWFRIGSSPNKTNAEPFLNASYLNVTDSSSSSTEECNTEDEFDNIPSLPKLTAWLPAKSIPDDKFIAMPTYLDHDGYLYLHSTEQSAGILANIEQKLEKLYKNCNLESCDTVWSVGDMCIAQYHDNKKWYRGKVVNILENDVVEVEFVDYGNVEKCPVGTLKKQVVLENIPVQSTKCLIYRLIPDNDTGKWTTLELDKIHSLLIDKKCIVNVLDRTDAFYVISVTIVVSEDTATDLISFLTRSCGFKIKPAESDVSDVAFETMIASDEESEEKVDIVEETSDKVISGFSTVLQKTFEVDSSITTTDVENLSWSKGKQSFIASTPYVVSDETLLISFDVIILPQDVEYIEIELTCSITAISFYVQLRENAHLPILNQCYNQYKRIMEDLQENASKQPMITTIAPDTPCCAKFEDNVWYRCLIMDTSPVDDSDDVEVKLLFVDYGNNEYRRINPQKSELYSLKKDWLDLPAVATKCKIWNVELSPSARNTNVILPHIEKMYNKPVIATVKEIDEEFTSLVLYKDKDCKELLYSSIIDKGWFIVAPEGKDEHSTSE